MWVRWPCIIKFECSLLGTLYSLFCTVSPTFYQILVAGVLASCLVSALTPSVNFQFIYSSDACQIYPCDLFYVAAPDLHVIFSGVNWLFNTLHGVLRTTCLFLRIHLAMYIVTKCFFFSLLCVLWASAQTKNSLWYRSYVSVCLSVGSSYISVVEGPNSVNRGRFIGYSCSLVLRFCR
jgi:hypothetical protein